MQNCITLKYLNDFFLSKNIQPHKFGSLLACNLEENNQQLLVCTFVYICDIVSLSLRLVAEAVWYKSGDSPHSGYNFCRSNVRSNLKTNSAKITVTFELAMHF